MLSPYDQTIQIWELTREKNPTTYQFEHRHHPSCDCVACLNDIREFDNRRKEMFEKIGIAGQIECACYSEVL